MKLKIVLADDHAVVREGLKRLLETERDMEIVGEAGDTEGAVSEVKFHHPDILIVDLSMPGRGGLEAARCVHREVPDAGIIALTVHEDAAHLHAALDAGARGYVLKRAAPEELVPAVRAVSSGGTYIDPRLQSKLATVGGGTAARSAAPGKLSKREVNVLRGIATGFSNKEIAAQLDLSVKTVETYKARAMEKLSLRSRVDIVRLAQLQGWLPGPDQA